MRRPIHLMSKYRAYETAAIAAVDLWYDAAELFGVAQVMVVPEGVSRISRVDIAVAADGVGVGAGAFILRIQGDAVGDAQYLIAGAYGGTIVTSTGQIIGPHESKVSIPVTPGGQIQFSFAMNLDVGTCSAAVGIEYS